MSESYHVDVKEIGEITVHGNVSCKGTVLEKVIYFTLGFAVQIEFLSARYQCHCGEAVRIVEKRTAKDAGLFLHTVRKAAFHEIDSGKTAFADRHAVTLAQVTAGHLDGPELG